MSELIHLRENDPELESFLHENAAKFNGHCLLALKLMYSGIRLTDAEAVSKYGFSGRRLRELHSEFPNIVKKVWVLNGRGKRKYVQYFIEKSTSPTKQEAVRWATEFLDGQLQQGRLL
jgi:hypothetical protein